MRSRVLGLVVILLVACGGENKPAPISAKQPTHRTMLSAVPADTPYVIALLDQVPQSVRDVMFQYTDQKLARAIELMKSIPPGFDRSKLDVPERLGLAFLDELKNSDLKHWGRDLGLDPSGRFALYGLSVWPVLRVAVADPVKLRGVVARMIAGAGLGPMVVERTHEGRRYWSVTVKRVTILAAVLETEAVAAVVPNTAVGETLPLLLGTRMPDHSLAETRRVPDLLAAHHFTNLMFAYFDLQRVAAILTGRGSGPLESVLHEATGPISDVCKSDIERLVAIAPRFVMGYHTFDATRFHASIVAELAPDILHELQTLRTVVPEVVDGPAGNPLFSFGAAMKLDALIPVMARAVEAVKARPFQCASLEPVNHSLDELGQLIAKPLPPAFQGFRGISVVLEDFRKEPFDLAGSLQIATDRGPDLIALLQQNVPGMGGVTIVPDGRPVALPTTLFGLPPTTQLHAASRADRVAVAVGRTSAQRVRELVNAKTPQHSPLVMFAFDVPRMEELGLLDKEEQSLGSDNMTSVLLQVDAKDDGLALEVFGTFAKM